MYFRETLVGTVAAFIFLAAPARPAPAAGAPGPARGDLDIVKERLVASLTETVPPGEHVETLMLRMERGGRWPGSRWSSINYESQQRSPWPVRAHVSRLLEMAVAWRAEASPWHGSPRLRARIEHGLAYWLARDLSTERWAPNWFTREIAVPMRLGELGLLMEGHLSEAVWQQLLRRTAQAEAGRKGQNWVWKSAAAVLHGLLAGEPDEVARNVDRIFRNLKVTTSQGLQADWSFQQHGPQFQMGNYGLSFAGSMTRWLLVTRGTRFAPPPRSTRLMRNFLLHGQAWEAYRGAYDLNGAGRQIIWVTDTVMARPVGLEAPAERMAAIDSTHRAAYRDILQSLRRPRQPSPLTGNQWWWRSEVMVHRRPGWMASLKMSSERVMPHEYGNNENVRGGLLGLGSLFLYTDGQGDYDRIPEVWSWRRIPGATAGRREGPLRPMDLWGSYPNVARFSGGVSDGRVGAAAMEMAPADHEQVQQIRSRKSWFFFDDAYVALGKVLEADLSDEVVTTLSQEALDAPPTLVSADGERPFESGGIALRAPAALVHEQTAFVFPQPINLVVHGGPMAGSWYRAYPKPEQTNLKEEATREVFMLAASHGEAAAPRPTLSSIVFPTGGEAAARAFLEKPWIRILRNDEIVQAVQHEKAGVVQTVFFEEAELALPGGGALNAASPALVMLKGCGAPPPAEAGPAETCEVYVADPLRGQAEITVTLSGAYTAGQHASPEAAGAQAALTDEDGRTRVTIAMPREESARGRTVRVRLTPAEP